LTHDLHEAARNVLADLADHQRDDGWIPPASINDYTLLLFDYPLWWVACSYDLYMYTGNTTYVQQYYPSIVAALDNFYPSCTDNTTGLLSKGVGVSSGYGDYAFLPRTGPVTYYNTLYVLALNNAASIATFLGSASDAARWSARAQTVSAAINANNFDASAGAYIDTPDDAVSHPQDGNSIAVLAGVANASLATSALNYLSANTAQAYGNAFYDNDSLGTGFSQRVYAFLSYFEIEARFINGNATSALEEIKRLYGWMSTNDPTTTFWEGIGTNGSMYEGAYTSAAHGWSTGVVPALTNYVLGIIPTGPGFETWSFKPMPGDVTWASGQVPTPSGALSVNWTVEASDGAAFEVDLGVPTGTVGNVSVPAGGSSVVYVDAVEVWDAGTAVGNATVIYEGGYVMVQVGVGTHVVTVD